MFYFTLSSNSCYTPVLTLVLVHMYRNKPVYYIICKGGLVQAVRLSLIYSFSCASSEHVVSFSWRPDECDATTCAQKAPLHLWPFFLFIPTGCGNQLGIQGQSLGLCQWGESKHRLTQNLRESQSLNILFASPPFSSLVEYLLSFYSEMLSLSLFDVFTSAPFILCITACDPSWCLT